MSTPLRFALLGLLLVAGTCLPAIQVSDKVGAENVSSANAVAPAPSSAPAAMCQLFKIGSSGYCGSSMIECDYVDFAKAVEPGLTLATCDGYNCGCKQQGYKTYIKTTTTSYHYQGTDFEVTVYLYEKLKTVCQVFKIGDTGYCGSSELPCIDVDIAKQVEPGLTLATCDARGCGCKEQGYETFVKQTTASYRYAGLDFSATVDLYAKTLSAGAVWLGAVDPSE